MCETSNRPLTLANKGKHACGAVAKTRSVPFDRPSIRSMIATSLFVAVAMPAFADGYGQTARNCEALAHDYAYTGAKSGYADRYQWALSDCRSRQAAPAPRRTYRKPVVVVPAPVGCYPGAPRMYRGTLYCFD
ncbi:hypothetical protein SAMN04488078_10349 [Antarctobacter heliothermus]|uniref:Uncharacterized protein n=1 Tax=Antarctobacter heliothermus TaxID=74033 RepID=A0A239HKE7_9RHOB|nr:hypothetical protein SAMN04488078_10349 [Antarctobacter heliothermus]